MKKLIVFILPCLLYFSVQAQETADLMDETEEAGPASSAPTDKGVAVMQKTPDERAKWHTAKMSERLNLTSEQQAKIYEVNLERAKKVDEFKVKSKEARKAQRSSMVQLAKDVEAKYKQILTPEQYTSYVTWKEEKKAKRMQKKQQKKGNKKM